MRETSVHPTALVSPRAELGVGVTIGPYAVVGDGVTVGDRTSVGSHVVIEGPTTLGADNVIFPFASIGQAPQDLKFHGERTELHVGDQNQIREYVTLHRGTEGGGSVTRVGSDNLLMVGTHVAHDCVVGDRCILANNATLAGHVTIGDDSTIGAFTPIHQFCRVGRHAFIGGGSIVVQDVVPFSRCQGNHARCYGENSVGLRRKGFSDDEIRRIHRAFRLLLAAKLNTSQALEAITSDPALIADPNVAYMVEFIESSERGIVKK
jgi:UDP-N-acetylglucosamine acyltransferase